ncbi:MAG: CehA/McbA family metallohydrolase [Candidatus Marinimicrobia bacterium]|nr:CehA/McbA family metallohydrolase [Candidatus Neomarinimicrobiota bacterium]
MSEKTHWRSGAWVLLLGGLGVWFGGGESARSLELTRIESDGRIHWQAETDSYGGFRVEWTTNLAEKDWQPLPGAAALAATGTHMSVTGALTGAPRFFRIVGGPHVMLQHGFQAHGFRHKVQLHSHTTNSDGTNSPTMLMQQYEALGYTAVALTDHDGFSHRPSLADPGGHGIIHIPGVEYSAPPPGTNNPQRHFLAVGLKTIHQEGVQARQAQINQALAEGGLPIVPHPNVNPTTLGWTLDVLATLTNYVGVEVFNSWTQDGRMFAEDKIDALLTQGLRLNLFAVSDYHKYPERLEGGYVVVNSPLDKPELDAAEILAALRNGNFYSAGRARTNHPAPPNFTRIEITNRNEIVAAVDRPATLAFITQGGVVAQTHSNATSARYVTARTSGYVRVRATLEENDQAVAWAWSNPIYVETYARYHRLLDGLRGYWRLDEQSQAWGTDVWDRPSLLLEGAASWVAPGHLGAGALDLATDGACASLRNEWINAPQMTFNVWVYLDQAAHTQSRRAVAESWSHGYDFGYNRLSLEVGADDRLHAHFNVLEGASTRNVTITDSEVFPLREWVMVSLTRASGTQQLYRNGAQVASATEAELHPQWCAGLRLGTYRHADGRYWPGRLDEVALWDRALSPTEIQALYNGGAGFPHPFQP